MKEQFTKKQAIEYVCNRYSINPKEITNYTYGMSFYHSKILHCIYWGNNWVPFTCTDKELERN